MVDETPKILDRFDFKSMSQSANLNRAKYLKRTKDFINIVPEDLPKGSHALDIGIAHGWFSILLHELYGCKVKGIGLESDEKFTKNYRKYDIEFSCCDITKGKLPYPDDYFDLVVFTEVLEHLICLHPPYTLFDEINRVMKEQAYLIFSTPNFCSIQNRITMLLGSNPSYWPKLKAREPVSHIREYTKKELIYILEECGFKISDIIFSDQRPPPKGFKNKLYRFPFQAMETFYPPFRNTILNKAQKSKMD